MTKKTFIFSDIDSTFLDTKANSCGNNVKVLNNLQKRKIPVIFSTSKSIPEIIKFQKTLNYKEPFIAENGGALLFPVQYGLLLKNSRIKTWNSEYLIIEFGLDILSLKIKFKELFADHTDTIRLADEMSEKEFSEISGLNREDSAESLKRKYDLMFYIQKENSDINNTIRKINSSYKYRVQKGGIFHHFTGNHNKGSVMPFFISLMNYQRDEVRLIGIGDSENDIEMLSYSDTSILIRSSDQRKTLALAHSLPAPFISEKKAPWGWQETVEEILFQEEFING